MKIGILTQGFLDWGGGADLLRQYINALQSQNCEIVLLIIEKNTTFSGKVVKTKVIAKSLFRLINNSSNHSSVQQNTIQKDFFSDYSEIDCIRFDLKDLNSICATNSIDIIFPSANVLPSFCRIPWIGYIYDFQHKYYPKYFSKRAYLMRDHGFQLMLKRSKAVVTNSYDTMHDCKKFVHRINARIYVTPFSPSPKSIWLDDNFEILKPYGIHYRYIVICNQLWKHKGHSLAINAMKILNTKNYDDIHLICTGSTFDHRFPNYFDELQGIIKQEGLTDKIHFLGYVPKNVQIELIKHSEAVIQPTMFEGGPGGGIAAETIALGKRIILSDIDVNKEIRSNLAYFFKSGDAGSLAETIGKVLSETEISFTNAELLATGKKKTNDLGSFLISMCQTEIKKQKEIVK